MRWSEAVTLEFVKIYLKRECLWNPAHSGYKIKYQRDKAYSEISSELKSSTNKILSVPEVKMKIKNLRTTYAQQVHKILEKSSPDAIYEPSLIWFHEMDQCLKNIPTNRQSASFHNSQETPEVDSSCHIWVDHDIQNSSQELHPDPLIPPTDDEYESTRPEEAMTKKPDSMTTYNKIKKKKIKQRSPVRDYSTDSNSELMSKEDEFDIYGKYIAAQLRKMDLHRAIRIQLEIQNLVSEARIADILHSD